MIAPVCNNTGGVKINIIMNNQNLSNTHGHRREDIVLAIECLETKMSLAQADSLRNHLTV